MALQMDLALGPLGFRAASGSEGSFSSSLGSQSIHLFRAPGCVTSWLRARGARGHRAKARQASGPFFQLSSAFGRHLVLRHQERGLAEDGESPQKASCCGSSAVHHLRFSEPGRPKGALPGRRDTIREPCAAWLMIPR